MGIEEPELISQSKSEKKQSLLEKFDISIENISYEYIGQCRNGKELERILRILRSGEEGVYPHLVKFTEDRLEQVKPDSTLLRVSEPVINRRCLAPRERRELDDELTEWMRDVRLRERDLADERELNPDRQPLPQPSIRQINAESKQRDSAEFAEFISGENRLTSVPKSSDAQQRPIEKRISSCDYASWDKYDADTELNRMDLIEEQEKIKAKKRQEQRKIERTRTKKETVIEKSLLTGTELSVMSAREREKGNEAFRARDYEEALQLYSTSIAMDDDVNAYNNRAITHIKLKNYDKAIKDCNEVLNIDPLNVKAFLRRALAFQYLQKEIEALKDYEAVLKIEPSNEVAISAVSKLRKDDETKKVRLTIEEIYDE